MFMCMYSSQLYEGRFFFIYRGWGDGLTCQVYESGGR